ncbi:MAG: hypothetical protein ACOZAN_01885 [Patescibacteria group bacterium]
MNEGDEQKTADTLTPVSLARGEMMLQEARAAQETGNQQAVTTVKEKILSDPSFGDAVTKKMAEMAAQGSDQAIADQSQEMVQDEEAEAQRRLTQIVGEVKDLYVKLIQVAIANRNPGGTHDSIGEKGETNLKAIVAKVDELLNTGTAENVEEAVQALNVDGYAQAITGRIKNLVGYFGGQMPNELRIQATILDQIKAANERLKTANADWQKAKGQ